MVRDYDTSPPPECDVNAATGPSTAVVNALTGGDGEGDQAGGGGVYQRAITDALAAVKAHHDGDADRLMPSKVDAAYIALWSLRELGILDCDLVAALE